MRRFEYKPDSGGFEEIPSTKHRMTLGETLPAESGEIAQVLRRFEPAVHPYADYFAALLVGEMNEVPIKLNDGSCTFASRDYPSEFQFAEIKDFLRIPNMLRIYDDVPLEEGLSVHRVAISKLTALLSLTATGNSEFAELLESRVAQAKKLTGRSEGEASPYQVQYLDDLASAGEWAELVDTSRTIRQVFG